tara:strand:+ start:467 stop:1744 length:1278 start_codon:yes stop_codon:yes gene_type:complete
MSNKWAVHNTVVKNIDDLIEYDSNPRTHSVEQVEQVANSIETFGWTMPILIDESNEIIAGHGRLMAGKKLGIKEVPCIVAEGWSEQQKKAYCIADNKLTENGTWDKSFLKLNLEFLADVNFNLETTGFSTMELKNILSPYDEFTKGSLEEKFGVPPFSILDTRQGYWQKRKKDWSNLIMDLGESREKVLSGDGVMEGINKGVSIFDPVLAELMVLWFSQKGFKCFDIFAGGMFGFVCSTLGTEYTGIELRQEQVDINNARVTDLPANYICDDGINVGKHIKDNSQDMFFTCPPYADLEVYSDLKDDLSNMEHDEFFKVYEKGLTQVYNKLKENRFAVIVVSEVRNKKGEYISLVPKTIDIMTKSGFTYYNEIILVNAVGTLAFRANRTMISRKIGRSHQNILVFYKGDIKEIKNVYTEQNGFVYE